MIDNIEDVQIKWTKEGIQNLQITYPSMPFGNWTTYTEYDPHGYFSHDIGIYPDGIRFNNAGSGMRYTGEYAELSQMVTFTYPQTRTIYIGDMESFTDSQSIEIWVGGTRVWRDYDSGTPTSVDIYFPSGTYEFKIRYRIAYDCGPSPVCNMNNIFRITGYSAPSPANIISSTLTVDTNDCVTPCTVNGTVSWTNTGGTASDPTDLIITYNGGSTTVAPGVVIGPGETTVVYPFTTSNLADGTYTVQAFPNTGTAPQIITVRTPANVISTTLTVDTNDCIAPCTVNGTVSWTNNGGTASDPTDLAITYNGGSTTVASGVVIGPGETTVVYPFTISNLADGTYTVQAFPNTGTAPQIITVLTPAHIISTMTVDTNDCVAPCTINGTVNWTNTGGTTSLPTDLSITVNGTTTIIAPAMIIGPGEMTDTYSFQLLDYIAGIYNICASQDVGTNCQTTTVRNPANIIATNITPSITTCTEPCNLNVDVTWTNIGDISGIFIPSIKIDGTPISPAQYPSESLDAGISVTRTFAVAGLVENIHTICPDPNTGINCITITVGKVAQAGFGIVGMLFLGGLLIGMVSRKKCKDNKTREECERNGCLWENGKCIERK